MFGGKAKSILFDRMRGLLTLFRKDKGKTHGGVSCEKCKVENFGAECNTGVCFDDYSRSFGLCYDFSELQADVIR